MYRVMITSIYSRAVFIMFYGIGCSVEAVQRRLASLVSIPVGEQILIVNGTPLDPRQTLADYKLPVQTPTPVSSEECHNL